MWSCPGFVDGVMALHMELGALAIELGLAM